MDNRFIFLYEEIVVIFAQAKSRVCERKLINSYYLGIDGAGIIESGDEYPDLNTKAVFVGKSARTFN